MVVLSQPNLPATLSQFKTCKSSPTLFAQIPVVDLSDTKHAPRHIVHACNEFGFFKVVNHGLPMEFLSELEAEAVQFFNLPQHEKDKSGPPNPFGYGNKKIGPYGDIGWVEYLLFCTNPELISYNPDAVVPAIPQKLRALVSEYVVKVRNLACQVVEMAAEGLGIYDREVFSRLVRNGKSDSCFRLNHYPPCPEFQQIGTPATNLLGFGEHTDPQLVSVLRSNSVSGLQICLKDGSWVSVPSDPTSFFINVGDCFQAMTNGRFKSVKHRVLAGGLTSRVSMIYFAGPPLCEKIKPLETLMADGEESMYKEFTWSEFKKSAYKTRLSDNRLSLFQKHVL